MEEEEEEKEEEEEEKGSSNRNMPSAKWHRHAKACIISITQIALTRSMVHLTILLPFLTPVYHRSSREQWRSNKIGSQRIFFFF